MDNLSSYILDLIQNSIRAKSEIIICEIKEDDKLHLRLSDNGCGMDEKMLKESVSPYFTTRKTRNVGLGLSMIQLLSTQTMGSFNINSHLKIGTTLDVSFDHHHLDMPPMGDLGEMIYLISIHQDVHEFLFTYQKNHQSFHYQLTQIKEMLGLTITNIEIKEYLMSYINQEIMKVRGIE